MAINYVGGKKYKLKSSINATDTSIVLQSLTKVGDDSELTMSDFGEIGYATLEPGTSKKEFISFTGITQSSTDNTATLTGVTRGIDPASTYASDTSLFGKTHSGGAILIFSNSPVFYSKLTNKENAETINETWTFAQGANTSAGDPTSDNELARKAYVDSVVNGGTVSINRVAVAGNAGETVAAGDVLYFKNSDQEWYKADASTSTTTDNIQLGIAQGAGTDGNAVSNGVLIMGLDSNQSGLTPGTDYYLSDTAGALATSAGTVEMFVGVAKSATEIIVNFNSESSRFLETDDVYRASTDQEQTTNNGTVEVGESDTATNKNSLAQSFIPTRTKIRGVQLHKEANTGTFTGTVTIALQADSGGDPSGSDLATVTIDNTTWDDIDNDSAFDAIFSTEYGSMVIGDTYWIVISTSTADDSNHPNFGTNTAGGYANGSVKYNNSSDGWTSIATIDLTFKTLNGVVNQIVSTDSNGVVKGVAKLPIVNVFTSTDVWVRPIDLSYVKVEVVGGGGGGDGEASGDHSEGGGGGGGYSCEYIAASTLKNEEIVTVGAGGTGGTSPTAGGTSSFGTSAYLQATGGSAATDSTGGAGGVGSSGDINIVGQDGDSVQDDSASDQAGGSGGSSVLGGGGRGGVAGAGQDGNNYGGGGGGGANTSGAGNGGAGAGGVVIITEFY